MPRSQFRSTRQVVARRTAAKRTTRFVLTAAAFGAAVYFLLPGLSKRPEDLRQRFIQHKTDFAALRDMIGAENGVASVGVDNVGDFWLFDGQWTASGKRFMIYTKSEMLESSGLSPDRYRLYLDNLSKVGAYRIARHSAPGQPSRGTIFLFSPASGDQPAQNLIFSTRPPAPLLTWAAARRSSRTAYAKIDDGWYAEFQRP